MTTAESQHAPTRSLMDDHDLFSLIQRLADNKYWLGRRYAEWCTAAPTLESAVAASAMAQDEIGHARSLYPLFRDFTGEDIEPEDRDPFHSLSLLDRPFGSWVDFVATNFLVDTALTVVYESAQDSSYDDLRNRARRIAGEEQVHWLHGQGWVRRLAQESTGTKGGLEQALDRYWEEVFMWFGPSNGSEVDTLVGRGIVSRRPDELREDFGARVDPVLAEAAVEIANTRDQASLPWQRWDGERYRLT